MFITTVKKNAEENAQINIFPNPSTGKINLLIENLKYTDRQNFIEVFDVLGRSVFKETIYGINGSTNSILNLQHLSNGSYTVKLKTSEKIYTSKVIISK